MPLRDSVEAWLRLDGFDPEPAEDLPEGVVWRLSATYPVGFPARIRIEQREDVGDRIDLVINLRVSDAHWAGIEQASQADRVAFLTRLSMELLRGRPRHALAFNEEDEPSSGRLAGVQLQQHLYEEEIRRGSLMRAIRDVHSTASLVSVMLTDAFLE